MWERLRRFSGLPRPAKLLFVKVCLLQPWITLSLRLRGFKATRRMLQGLCGAVIPAPVEAESDIQTKLVSRMVLAAAKHSLFPSTCLERSLMIWWLLALRGITAQLRIGVKKSADKFEAHAWVERDGMAVGDPNETHLHYAAFAKEFSEESL